MIYLILIFQCFFIEAEASNKLKDFFGSNDRDKVEKISSDPILKEEKQSRVDEPPTPKLPKSLFLEVVKEETSKSIRYPVHATTKTYNSFTYSYDAKHHYGFLRAQFHLGQYDFLEKLVPSLKKALVLQPRLTAGFMGSEEEFRFFVATDNRIRLKSYGVGFKFLAEVNPEKVKDMEFQGFISSYAYKNMNVGLEGLLSLYVAFYSPLVQITTNVEKMADLAKGLLFNSKDIVAGFFYIPSVAENLAFSVESDGKQYFFCFCL